MQSDKELADLIRKDTGHNLVTCGHCGKVNIHKLGLTRIKCNHCLITDDLSVFPDLLY
jgi:hypothetical protein